MQRKDPTPRDPAVTPSAPRPGKERKGKPSAGKRQGPRILILEEDRLIGGLLFQMLAGRGYRVEAAETAPQALDKLKGKPYEMVIAGAAAMETRGLIRRLRKAAPSAFVAVLADPSGRGDGHAAADLVISRPIEMTSTLSRISETLTGKIK